MHLESMLVSGPPNCCIFHQLLCQPLCHQAALHCSFTVDISINLCNARVNSAGYSHVVASSFTSCSARSSSGMTAFLIIIQMRSSYNFSIGTESSHTYLLTPWSRVLPEMLKRPKLLKKFPAFYGTRKFITVFTTARHLSLS